MLWFKVSKRREMDISTVAACFTVDLDRQNVVRHARLAYGGVAAMPARAKKTESALLGKSGARKPFKACCRFCGRSSPPSPMFAAARPIAAD